MCCTDFGERVTEGSQLVNQPVGVFLTVSYQQVVSILLHKVLLMCC